MRAKFSLRRTKPWLVPRRARAAQQITGALPSKKSARFILLAPWVGSADADLTGISFYSL
jgi:hypothetical protein